MADSGEVTSYKLVKGTASSFASVVLSQQQSPADSSAVPSPFLKCRMVLWTPPVK